ncbi:MAG: hypothetical protein Tsb0020_46120 [Haliangiales bacterium]
MVLLWGFWAAIGGILVSLTAGLGAGVSGALVLALLEQAATTKSAGRDKSTRLFEIADIEVLSWFSLVEACREAISA